MLANLKDARKLVREALQNVAKSRIITLFARELNS